MKKKDNTNTSSEEEKETNLFTAEASMGKYGRSSIMGKLLSTIRFIIKIINGHDALPET
jgi:hypothetical protein